MKIEGEFYDRTTTPECSEDRTAVLSIVKTESELCVCMCPRSTHTHMKECKAEWQNQQTLNISLFLEKTGSSPFIYPFVYQPTCTTVSVTHARNQANRMSGVDNASEGPTLASWETHPLSVLPSVPTSHPWNEHQTPCKPCTKQDMWNQTWYHLHLRASCSTIIP